MKRDYTLTLRLGAEDQGPTDDPLSPTKNVQYSLVGNTTCYDHTCDEYPTGLRRWKWHLFVHRYERDVDEWTIVASLNDDVEYPHPLPCAQAMEAWCFTPVELLGVRWYDIPGLQLKRDHRSSTVDHRSSDVKGGRVDATV